MSEFLPESIIAHFSDCYAPNGIKAQIEKHVSLSVYQQGIQSFEGGKGHYAYNNRHCQNNDNGAGESGVQTSEAGQGISKYKLMIPLIILCLFGSYWINQKK